MTIYNSITELVGKTPVIKLNSIVPEGSADVYVKLEAFNPGSSVKDRIALRMIEDAEKAGTIKPGDTIVEPTSGNTGIGLAWVGAAKGYKVVIVMPDTMSVERRKIIQAYGAELVLTPGSEGMKGAIAKAKEVAAESMGVNVTKMKVLIFVIGAMISAIAGSLYVSYIGTVVPKDFTIMKSIDYLIIAVLGGLGSITGTFIAAVVLGIINMFLQNVSNLRMIIYALALILVMLFRPGGLLGTKELYLSKFFNKSKEGK